MKRDARFIVFALLIGHLLGCGPKIDPALQPYIGGLKKKESRDLFFSKKLDEQIDIYLRVAALPLKPPDFSLSNAIAACDGDIGLVLSARLDKADNHRTINSLVRLAGDYCALNENCKGQRFLDASVRAAVNRLPSADREDNPYLRQSMDWVSMGIDGKSEEQRTVSPPCR
jgi:hypothetical protein